MNQYVTGTMIRHLRESRDLTQHQLAEKISVSDKAISKWETGHGFPDISTLSALADIFGVSERTLLSGSLEPNSKNTGNIKRIKFYVCPSCGGFIQAVGNSQVICCGKQLEPLKAKKSDEEHVLKILEIEGDYYIEIAHEMTKEHLFLLLISRFFARYFAPVSGVKAGRI